MPAASSQRRAGVAAGDALVGGDLGLGGEGLGGGVELGELEVGAGDGERAVEAAVDGVGDGGAAAELMYQTWRPGRA